MENKNCNRCQGEKVITDFPFKNKAKDIRHGACTECWKEIRKTSYDKNKKTTLLRNTKNKKKTRNWYIEYKSTLKCSNCNENHPACLEFHHVDPNTKEYDVSIMLRSTVSVEKLKKEIDKCVILCSNCHKKHHYSERNK